MCMHVHAVAVAMPAGATAVNQEASGREGGRAGRHMCSTNGSNGTRSGRVMRRREGIHAALAVPVLAAEAVAAGAAPTPPPGG